MVWETLSGSSVKTPLLLSAIQPSAYVPLDIAGDFLRASSAALAQKFPGLPVLPVEADFMRRVELPGEIAHLPKLGFFPGSTIGNMIARTGADLLRNMRATLGDGAQLLIGMDLVKDRSRLLAAYDDAAGVTAAFNRNLLVRINRELGGDIPLEAFAHEARWNDAFARIEMHLVATRAVTFQMAERSFALAEGASIHTENSHKYTTESAGLLLAAGGWTPLQSWADPEDDFMLTLPMDKLPDALVSSCQGLDGVTVEWISRYPEGGGLQSDLETLERMTADPEHAAETLVAASPTVFRSHWSVLLQLLGPHPGGQSEIKAVFSTPQAPDLDTDSAGRLGPFDATHRIDLGDDWREQVWNPVVHGELDHLWIDHQHAYILRRGLGDDACDNCIDTD